jgi:hypothetical protein
MSDWYQTWERGGRGERAILKKDVDRALAGVMGLLLPPKKDAIIGKGFTV